jgi:prepilin-type N-terminal cleavage/methylation domain-containing protein/prepilin-type processing-associated H-X9-DG protein
MKTSRKTNGFTLVELLVVIAIVAVLASVAFLLGRSAIKTAHASTSANNLKQIGTSLTLIREEGVIYSGSSPGMFPGYAGQIAEPGNWREFNIYQLIGETLGACKVVNKGYEWNVLPSKTILQNPLSKHKFAKDAKTPKDVTHKMLGNARGSYCYNAHLEGWISPGEVEIGKAKLTRMIGKNTEGRELTDPSLTIMMGETNDAGGGQSYTGWSSTAPQGNYKDGAHCVFVDGHVERLPNKFLRTEAGWRKHMQPNAVR